MQLPSKRIAMAVVKTEQHMDMRYAAMHSLTPAKALQDGKDEQEIRTNVFQLSAARPTSETT